jgi:hypothetical protein
MEGRHEDGRVQQPTDGLSVSRWGHNSDLAGGASQGDRTSNPDFPARELHVQNVEDGPLVDYEEPVRSESPTEPDPASSYLDGQVSTAGSEPQQSPAERSGAFDVEAQAASEGDSAPTARETETEASPYKWDWQPPPLPRIESGGPESTPSAQGVDNSSDASTPSTADSSGTGDYVSAMSVAVNGRRRTALLPRMSSLDEAELDREIADLHAEIAIVLPIGHETAERARHLLDKAYTILHSDPMLSAEVEYYMQQVRTIVQRVRQTHRWSNLYRDRLRVYLGSWILLCLVVLLGCYLLQLHLQVLVASITDAATDSVVVRHSAVFVISVFAGALGGASGALLTMQRHTQQEYGFFDRKYGLRGLMLPIIGAVLGAILYIIFGVVYRFAGIDPSMSIIAATIPAMAAFALGFSQESIYGIRD